MQLNKERRKKIKRKKEKRTRVFLNDLLSVLMAMGLCLLQTVALYEKMDVRNLYVF